MATFRRRPLSEVLGPRGYVRGPFGSALVRGELQDHGIPVYEQQHAITGTREFRYFSDERKLKELSRFQVRPNDLIVSCSGTVGSISVIQPDDPLGIISQALLILRPRTDLVLPEFLFYFLSTREGKHAITQASHGSVQVNIAPRGVVEQIEMPVPSLTEQHAIVDTLGAFDAKIDLNHRMSQILESMARALFKSWFVDFDPVRAKAEGRDLGIPRHLSSLFPAALVDSELGPIPEGWHIEALGSHVTVERGVSYGGAGLGSGDLPMHNLNSVYEGGGYKDGGIKFYAGEYRPRHVAQPGDLIVANTEQGHHRLLIGYAAIVPSRYPNGLFSHHLYRVQALDESPLSSEYLCWLLNSDVMHETVSGYANGTTVNMLPIAGLQRPPVCVPPEDLIRAFTSFVKEIRLRSEVAFRSGITLAAFRDRLLPGLLSGALVVGEVLGQSGGEL